QPLADEVNELLDLHRTSLSSARDRASDLAHGLKTPLTVMLTLALDLRAVGQDGVADEIEEQVSSMRYYIERELARVRTQSPAGISTDAAPVVNKMVSAIRKFPREKPLDWEVEIPDNLRTPFDEHDLSELLGNIFDNARKWAKSRVRIIGKALPDGVIEILIEDDGPGVAEDMLSTILTRGERLDPNVQGHGLGLAICADLVENYGAEFILERSSLGGLAVTTRWKFD
ncbi:MAG: ATP-binding protein, partial [Alphaproteobacteria bacterium]